MNSKCYKKVQCFNLLLHEVVNNDSAIASKDEKNIDDDYDDDGGVTLVISNSRSLYFYSFSNYILDIFFMSRNVYKIALMIFEAFSQNRPDIIIEDFKDNKSYLRDMAISYDKSISAKE